MGSVGWVGWLRADRSSERAGGAGRRDRSRGGSAVRCVSLPIFGAVLPSPGNGRVRPGIG
eukprot:1549344-Heterocapsa_arctica.AAC.1